MLYTAAAAVLGRSGKTGQDGAVPLGGGGRAEEDPPHVIVDADDVEALPGEEADGLGPDPARRAGDENGCHVPAPFLVYSRIVPDVPDANPRQRA